jgi:V/A-type H+/Na+-transporting ATPase subunit D
MAIRIPPGRAGRLWLLRRLEVARRGADVLDQKRRTLLREQERLAERLAAATADWERQADVAAEWNTRALTIAGPRRLLVSALESRGHAEVSVEWRNTLGLVVPASARVQFGARPDFVALGGGSSVALAAQAHEQALVAAVAHAAARMAYLAITTELAATTRRLRAIERRWIPDHEAELARLELRLEELELEDITRARWAQERQVDGTAVRGRARARHR